jgi:predicted nucleic acid-binding Zn finger protein
MVVTRNRRIFILICKMIEVIIHLSYARITSYVKFVLWKGDKDCFASLAMTIQVR